jgi:serine/threonine-protein kinase
MTQAGVILGTAAYMSPEQARGKPVDRRADIWSFGCVLFEMLTGQRAFDGEDVSDTLAAVLRGEPDWAALPDSVPASVRRLLKRLLARNLRERLQHIGDARIELEATEEPARSAHTDIRSRWQIPALLMAAGLVVGAAGGFGWRSAGASLTPALPVMRFAITPPTEANIGGGGGARLAISRDGKLIAFTGNNAVHVRPLTGFDAYSVRGTEAGLSPFFSPDSAWLGFASDRKLRRVPVEGGLPTTVAELPGSGAVDATWLDNDMIVYALDGVLFQVPARGGTPERVTSDEAPGFFSPVAIPGQEAVLARKGAIGSGFEIVAVALATGASHAVTTGIEPKVSPTGDLLFVNNGTLWRAPFDTARFVLTGAPVAVVEGILTTGLRALFDVSSTGTLVYVGANREAARLVWLDSKGNQTSAFPEPAAYLSPRLSPDGQRIAVIIARTEGGSLWVIDVSRGTRIPLTPGQSGVSRPIWSRDGSTITFMAGTDVHIVPALGGSPKIVLESPGTQFPDDWTADGKTLIYNTGNAVETRDLWTVTTGEAPRPLFATPFGERGAKLSPDGKWIAFVSTDAGRDDVYVAPFPGTGARVPVSPSGGRQPLWSRDGTRLFFRQDDWMMAIPVRLAPFEFGRPERLFRFERHMYMDTQNHPDYDVSSDGRFLAVRQPTDASGAIRVVVNWAQEVGGAQ